MVVHISCKVSQSSHETYSMKPNRTSDQTRNDFGESTAMVLECLWPNFGEKKHVTRWDSQAKGPSKLSKAQMAEAPLGRVRRQRPHSGYTTHSAQGTSRATEASLGWLLKLSVAIRTVETSLKYLKNIVNCANLWKPIHFDHMLTHRHTVSNMYLLICAAQWAMILLVRVPQILDHRRRQYQDTGGKVHRVWFHQPGRQI